MIMTDEKKPKEEPKKEESPKEIKKEAPAEKPKESPKEEPKTVAPKEGKDDKEPGKDEKGQASSKDEKETDKKEESKEGQRVGDRRPRHRTQAKAEWIPKTNLGQKVFEGKITTIEEIFSSGQKIQEPEIVDKLLPTIDNELILTGGSPGKGGGKRRTPARRTARMHKSGRRFKTSSLVVVGNHDGYVGMGIGRGMELRNAITKAVEQAKKAIIPVKRGCGSWECGCGNPHSIPVSVTGKYGSVKVDLKPAPRGIGLVASEEAKKVLQLAGVQDVWCKSYGQTQTTMNFSWAIVDAFKNLNKMKIPRGE